MKKFFTLFAAAFASLSMCAATIYSTDFSATPTSPATATIEKGNYVTEAVSWATNYPNYFTTTGSAGACTLTFDPAMDLSAYSDVKIKVYWGAAANRPLNLTVNGGTAAKIDEVAASADRSQLREAEADLSVTSLASIKLSSSGGGQVYLFHLEITAGVACENPAQALALAANKTTGLYEGDTVTFSITGGNGAATTLEGAASEVITNNQWIATAGEHTFTLSQEVNNGICGGTDQLVLNVAQKTPVTAAVVTGAAAAYVGDEVTLTCEAANATTFQWYQGANAISGATEATYKFTPDAAAEYTFACEAGNEFTATPVKSADFTVTVTNRPPAPTVVFHWQYDGETTAVDQAMTATGGTVTLGTTDSGKSWGTESFTYDASVPTDMKATMGLKSGGNALFIKIDLDEGVEEGDTIYLSGYKVWDFGTTQGTNNVVDDLNTGADGKSAVKMGYAVVPEGISANTIYVMRGTSTGMALAAIKIVRPADVGGDPTLKVNTNAANVKATAAEPTATAKVIFSGKHLAPGTYNLTLTQVAGLSVSPTSITVPENGKFSQEVTISFTATQDVSMNMAELSLTIGELTQSVLISYSAKMSHEYGRSIDFEQFITDNGKTGDFTAALDEANYIASLSGFSLDSLDEAKTDNNEPYLGLKIKSAGGYIGCWLHKSDTINILFGHVSANVIFTAGDYPESTKTPEDLAEPFVFVAEEADIFVKLQTTSGDAVVLKHILITGKAPEPQAIPNVESATKVVKIFRNGQLLILRDNKVYTITGQEL